jgi:hypothetical protein
MDLGFWTSDMLISRSQIRECMLTVFLDSTSIDSVYDEKQILIENLLSRDASLFKIFRTNCDVDKKEIKKIPSRTSIEKNQSIDTTLNTMYEKLSFRPKNPCQEQFFLHLLTFANQKSHNQRLCRKRSSFRNDCHRIFLTLLSFGI